MSNLLAMYCPLGAVAMIMPAAKAPVMSAMPNTTSAVQAMKRQKAKPATG